jgi:hypothetical protein
VLLSVSALNIAIARIEYYDITTQEAPGREDINDDCEAQDLTNEYTVPNDGLDVFMVLTYAGSTIGLSAPDGPCDKNDGWFTAMSGSVIAVRDSASISGQKTGQVIAHEVGHYLGLDHALDLNAYYGCTDLGNSEQQCYDQQPPQFKARLMFPRVNIDGSNIAMTSEEGETIREHCLTFRCKPV